jgi:hypothetical protein
MKVLRRFARAMRRRITTTAAIGTVAAVLSSLGPEQRAFVEDEAQRKAALCGRQSGKSHSVAAWLVVRGLECPDGDSVFIALTRSSARTIIFRALKKICTAAGIRFSTKNEDGQLYYVLENGHRIWITGCPHVGEIDKFRGVGFWSVAVDECGFMAGYLEELIEGVLDATLVAQQGKIALTSTPGVVPVGYFYDVTTGGEKGQGWSLHHWTILSNIGIPHAQQWLADRMKRFGWNELTPIYLREWLGRWVNDMAGLVYPFSKQLNAWDGKLPEGRVTTVLGVDVGFTEAMGFVIVSTVDGTGKKFIRYAEKQEGMTPNMVVARVRQLKGQWGATRVIVDEGGAGKGYAVHMREEGLACEAAQKTEKRANQEWMAGEILPGNILVHWEQCRPLVDEALVLRWGEKGTEDPRFPNHACDAALYGCRALRVSHDSQGAGEPPPGTAAHAAIVAARYKAKREADMRKAARKKGRGLVRCVTDWLCQVAPGVPVVAHCSPCTT